MKRFSSLCALVLSFSVGATAATLSSRHVHCSPILADGVFEQYARTQVAGGDAVDVARWLATQVPGHSSPTFAELRAAEAEEKARPDRAWSNVLALLAAAPAPTERFDIPVDALLAATGRSREQLSHFVLANRSAELAGQAFFTRNDLNSRYRADAEYRLIEAHLARFDYGGLLVGRLAAAWGNVRRFPTQTLSRTQYGYVFQPEARVWVVPDTAVENILLADTATRTLLTEAFEPLSLQEVESFFATTSETFAEVSPYRKPFYLFTDFTPAAARRLLVRVLNGESTLLRPEFRGRNLPGTFLRGQFEELLSRVYPVHVAWDGERWRAKARVEAAVRTTTPLALEESIAAFTQLYGAHEMPLRVSVAIPVQHASPDMVRNAGAALETVLVLDRVSRVAGPQRHTGGGSGSLLAGSPTGGAILVESNALSKPFAAHLLSISGLLATPLSVTKAAYLLYFASWLLDPPHGFPAYDAPVGHAAQHPVYGNVSGALRSAQVALQRSQDDRWVAEVLGAFAEALELAPNPEPVYARLRQFLVEHSVVGRLRPVLFRR